MSLVDMVAVWGAVVATAVAVKELWEHFGDRSRIQLEATIMFLSVNESTPPYGTRFKTELGIQEVVVHVVVSNRGRRSAQIVSVFVAHQSGNVHQVKAIRLPAIIEGGCQVETRVQKEWLDDPDVVAFGVLDGLGNRHSLAVDELEKLLDRSRSLPTDRAPYRRRDEPEGDAVWAWQVRDQATLSSKRRSESSSQDHAVIQPNNRN
jgi:hypothetical protein